MLVRVMQPWLRRNGETKDGPGHRRERRTGRIILIGLAAAMAACLLPLRAAARQSYRWPAARGLALAAQVPGAKRIGSAVCQTCHASLAGRFQHAWHAQQGVRCEDCHGGGSLHVQGRGDVSKIVSFRRLPPKSANAVCLRCHAQGSQTRHWITGAHAANGVRCIDCHSIHTAAPARPGMIGETLEAGYTASAASISPDARAAFASRSRMNDTCLRCHPQQRAQLNLPYHHPLREAKITCVDCHDPHGGAAGNNLRRANVNQLCLSCHAQYRGPFAYQHPPVNENCLICHQPHGSQNTNLLRLSEPALCLQCHTGHHNGANLPLVDRCTDCHGSIHGSDVPTASGGSRFVDKGANGVPQVPPQHALAIPIAARGALRAAYAYASAGLPSASAPAAGPAYSAALPALAGGNATEMLMMRFLAGQTSAPPQAAAADPAASAFALSFSPAQYRFVDLSGFGGRVGEYDSLQESAGGTLASSFVSPAHKLTLLSRVDLLTGNDYRVSSQLNLGRRLDAAFDLRSLVQHQDNYPFYSNVISPDIITDQSIPAGALFAVTRRLGNAHARLKLPGVPVYVFARGNWQAREGTSQAAWLDESDPSADPTACTNCHYHSRFQPVNQTTRTVTAGAEIRLPQVNLTWEHAYSSFNDRLAYPNAFFGGFFTPNEPVPVPVPSTPPGVYSFDIPADNRSNTDTARLNWTPSSQVTFDGNALDTRGRDIFTGNRQNIFDASNTLDWQPDRRLKLLFDYRQQNLVNDFVPYFNLYGNVSYHEHWAGARLHYALTHSLELVTQYERNGITRSNAFLWPQIYDIDNTDPLHVVPKSWSNTVSLGLRFHPRHLWSARAGYAFTGTHDPGYLVVPGSNNRVYADLSLFPASWIVFSNDASFIFQNAFAAVPLPNTPGDFQRRNRFYNETAALSLLFQPNWNFDLGYSYQQNLLNTYMGLQNDAGVNYVLDEPFVPYNQLNQSYWARFGTHLLDRRLLWNAQVTYNSARSGMTPDLNPAHAAQLGNAALIQQGVFDPVAFGQALDALQLGSTAVSQVLVPEWIGSSKLTYRLPEGFFSGLLFYYGSYKDYLNPGLNGDLRTFTLYLGKTW